ncbi:MAG TPA: DUF3667 domain-containing protein [Chitinophagaceae bacterium]
MSHAPERKEKDCLNCGTIIHGRFCHVCGQENTEPKESFWSMIVHFFNDITHFDGKFFTSLKWLVRKPGFLSAEYMAGRRARYLHPIRMYVFTSAFFFIIFFSLFSAEKLGMVDWTSGGQLEKAVTEFSAEAYKNAKTKEDSLNITQALALIKPVTAAENDTTGSRPRMGVTFGDAADIYKTVAAYDSAQALLPSSERDNWLERILNRRSISLKQRYGHNRQQLWKDLTDKFIHSFPYMLFLSLPLYAFLLKLLYIRRKKFYYADHGIFLVHLYIFTFLLLLLFFAFDKLDNLTGLGVWNFLKAILVLYGIFYAFKAMKNFYKQGTGKTLLKFMLFNFLCFICLIILFAFFLIFSFYRI